jgi:chorismate mutase
MSLEEIRNQIDMLDGEIIALLEKRFEKVAELIDQKKTLTDRQREAYIISRIRSVHIQNVYREIFRTSKQMLIAMGFKNH